MRHDSENFAALEQAWEMYLEGDLDGALASALATLEVDDSSAEAHNLAGTIWSAMGHAEKGLAHFEQAVAADSLFLEAHINSAEALLSLGRADESLRRLDASLELATTSDQVADVLLLKTDALFFLARIEDAAAVLEQMPDGPFESPQVDYLIGRARLMAGDHTRANVMLEEAESRGVVDPDLHYYLALSREAMGDPAGAMVGFLQCRENDLSLPPFPWSMPRAVFERRLQESIREQPARVKNALEGALVVVEDVPGAEVVSEGVDPRAPAMMDAVPFRDGTEPIRRLFVYQRNVEGVCSGESVIPLEIARAVQEEVDAFLQAEAERTAQERGSKSK